ncbi:hypothetical protein AB0M12_41820 [Nocardia vinacea]|uniref:hypothetical protein n=1 Tax=Nocardia vinacea TaxID=96468 RepID=UPI0034180383
MNVDGDLTDEQAAVALRTTASPDAQGVGTEYTPERGRGGNTELVGGAEQDVPQGQLREPRAYDQARDLLDAATTTDGPGTGWDLHHFRHSGLIHLGESGASLLELMAKSCHRKAENLRRYFKPSPQAMRELTSLIGPGASRTH